ncbi:RICIN domain-containing protein [Streptomyces sp. YPW6]|uniref:RICIN domain-containing protein n=1 Tax=unclassified Streptomyces TaxID=2593676 RepID=UPI001C0E6870|nr:RICIN domain-containing protein [Streptomyces sp. YPW6]QWQ41687.1 RICIN domain-containing protein [Streptomyces sp. YPW6]
MERNTRSSIYRRLRRQGFVTSLVALLVLLVPAVAHADSNPNVRYTSTPYNAAIHEIRASYSWKCLDIRGGSTNVGAVIQTFDCKGRHHQRFSFYPVGGENFVIATYGGATCLGTVNASKATGAGVVQATGGDCLTLRWKDRGGNHWEMVETFTGQCLRDTGRRSQVVLGACGSTGEPWPDLWTPRFDRYFDYTNFF